MAGHDTTPAARGQVGIARCGEVDHVNEDEHECTWTADEVVELASAVAKLVPAGAVLALLALWQRSRWSAELVYATLADIAAVTGCSRPAAKKHLDALAECGFVTIVEATDGRRGGYTLRIEDAWGVLTPGLSLARGDPQWPLFDADQNVNPTDAKVYVSPHPIIDHGAQFQTDHGHGQDHRAAQKSAEITNEHDGREVNVSDSVDDSTRRLANEIRRRQREARRHLETAPGDARTLRAALGDVLPSDDAKKREQAATRHKLLCEKIRLVIGGDANTPDGFIHDVANLVLHDGLPERVVDRVLDYIRRRSRSEKPIENPGGYFRASIVPECEKRGIAPPVAPALPR